MQADTAWDEAMRKRVFPGSTLSGRANLFVMPNLDAANIVYNMVRVMTDGVAIGPFLMGVNRPAHILTTSSSVRRVVNMTAIAAVDAQIRAKESDGYRGRTLLRPRVPGGRTRPPRSPPLPSGERIEVRGGCLRRRASKHAS
ncbi:phosphate acyltransferase, partial [Staphylococcus aureus]|uniref:phosphate acyltransferase n=1 Tax=Staphylococcus aureus TaxID=1280 RepID=UPI0039BE69AD